MGAPLATTDTAGSQNVVRDVRNSFIIQIGMETPVTSRTSKAPKPMSTTPEWTIKKYAAASSAGTIEGVAPDYSSVAENNFANKSILLGRFQKPSRFPSVTEETKLMVKQYAVPGDAMQDNVADKGLELHRDIEFTFLSDNESVPAAAGSTASKTRGMPRWVSYDDNRFTDAGTTPAIAYRTPSGSILISKSTAASVTEDNLQSVILSIATARKKTQGDWWAVCQPAMKQAVSKFTRLDPDVSSSVFAVRRFNQTKGDTISMNVTTYDSDFGSISFMTSFWLDASVWFLLLDMDMVELGYAKPPTYKLLPDDGSSDRGLWNAIIVAECLNPQAHGKAITGAVG